MRRSLAIALITLLSVRVHADDLPRSRPEEQGVSSAQLLEFVEAPDSQVDAMNSFMLVRHGHVVAEGWWAPYEAGARHSLYSLSKSFTSTAVGLAIAEGKLKLDDQVLKFFPEDAPENPSSNLRSMRVSDLLRMSTGQQTEPPLNGSGSWTKTFLAHSVPFKPGTHFLYNTPATYMLSAIVQKVTGQTLLDYLKPRLFDPLGIENPTWETSPQGVSTGGYGLSIRTEDIAKFGQFYLQKGKWQGKQLVPAEWIDAATARQTSNGSNPDSDWDQGYGYQFWRSRNNAFRGDGAFGQYCIVLPEHDAVVVITSGVRDMQAVLNLVWDKLLPAFHTESLPADEAASKHLLSKLQGLTLQPISGTTETRSALGKTYYFPQNRAKLESIRLERQEETTSWVAQIDGKERCLAFRPAVWQKSRVAWGLFPEQPGATTGAWTSKDTFTAKICYYETPFILTMRLAFSGDEVRLNAETSVGFGPTKQAELVGSTTKPEPGSGREAAARAASDDRFQKWEEEISAFEKSDRETPPKKGGILFIGSSTIRLWKTLETDFPHHQVINRGFGGSEIADATHFAERIIFPYEPVQIFLRAGGNDIHNGKVPEEVAADFAAFVKKVRERLPNTEILYISVSPAPARWGENDKYRDLNRRIREMALGMPRVGVVDAYDVPLNPDGTARRDMFIEDLLHFNARGYKALAEVVRPYLPVAKR